MRIAGAGDLIEDVERLAAEGDADGAVGFELAFDDEGAGGFDVDVFPEERFDVGDAEARVAGEEEGLLGGFGGALGEGELLYLVGGKEYAFGVLALREEGVDVGERVDGDEVHLDAEREYGVEFLEVGAGAFRLDFAEEVFGEAGAEARGDFGDEGLVAGEGFEMREEGVGDGPGMLFVRGLTLFGDKCDGGVVCGHAGGVALGFGF